MSAAWNFVETGAATGPGTAEGPGETDYVEYLPYTEANGTGPFRVDNSGNVTANGVTAQKGGTDTSATAAASAPSFVSGTSLQVNATQDVMLYIAINTSASLAIAIGPTAGVATTILAAESAALGVITLRVPKSWFVKITGTVADLTITAVTC